MRATTMRLFSNVTDAAGAIGVFLGFYFLAGHDDNRGKLALTALVIGFTVVMGSLSWIRHFLLWKQDSKALGVAPSEPAQVQGRVRFHPPAPRWAVIRDPKPRSPGRPWYEGWASHWVDCS